jgi:hypothetical protein
MTLVQKDTSSLQIELSTITYPEPPGEQHGLLYKTKEGRGYPVKYDSRLPKIK